MILQKLKSDAEAYLGETVTQAVITVPAYFSDSQRQATKRRGKDCGPRGSAYCERADGCGACIWTGKDNNQKVLVYDLGGGTFDVSLLEIGDGVIEVLATSGNNRLGGDDFDDKVVDWMVAEFKKEQRD